MEVVLLLLSFPDLCSVAKSYTFELEYIKRQSVYALCIIVGCLL